MDIVFFNWLSPMGGADTKLLHLLPLLAPHWRVTLVPNNPEQLAQTEWTARLDAWGVRCCAAEDLPERMEGWAVSICNWAFFDKGLAGLSRRKGLKIAWSNEMMWHFKGEVGAVAFGFMDTLLYNSDVQRCALEPRYLAIMGGDNDVPPEMSAPGPDGESGWLNRSDSGPPVRWVMTGHYVDPAEFPFRGPRARRAGAPFVIGRLSRPDPVKFPPDFPDFYEGLGLCDPVKFRVMGWDERMASQWPGRTYDASWDLVPPMAEATTDFLASLDVMVYSLGPKFRESWGRVIVEAMLTGVVPLVPRGGGHHLENLVPHGVGGFLCDGPEEYGKYARMLQDDGDLLARLSLGAREWAVTSLCNPDEHLRLWRKVFEG